MLLTVDGFFFGLGALGFCGSFCGGGCCFRNFALTAIMINLQPSVISKHSVKRKAVHKKSPTKDVKIFI